MKLFEKIGVAANVVVLIATIIVSVNAAMIDPAYWSFVVTAVTFSIMFGTALFHKDD